jgi:crooked neck
MSRVKNKGIAPIQITAEQLLRESYDRSDAGLVAPKHKIGDAAELEEYRGRTRKQFEDRIRTSRQQTSNWIKYAVWELDQKEFARARSIFERAIESDATSVPVWLKYIESEMKTRNINHARNLCDRAVTLMPRVDKFWFKYVSMEETLGNIDGARQVFERWMAWEPDEHAWVAYVQMEQRYGARDRVRQVFERFTVVHPESRTWLKWTRFEEEAGDADKVREVFTLAIDTLGDDFMDEKLFSAYAKYETSLKEHDRARAIYKYALDRMPRSKSKQLHRDYTTFEKQYGDRDGIESVVLAKRRVAYEEIVAAEPDVVDNWFDYIRMEEAANQVEKVRDLYERAIAQAPAKQKRLWRRYIYLWLNYAVFEEEQGNLDRSRAVYKAMLAAIPHTRFTFAKAWAMFATFELRQGNLTAARKIFGQAIGKSPKDKLFKYYIDMELSLKEFDRCRILYQKQLEYNPSSCTTWIQFATLETELGDDDRARAIYELGIAQNSLDMPELLWKSYIDFEFEGENYDKTRLLYERLLAKTMHVKVWTSFAQFELSVPEAEEDEETSRRLAAERCRGVFLRAHTAMKQEDIKEDRITLLESWSTFEGEYGTEDTQAKVRKLMPKSVKRRRELEDGSIEEYVDYLFPSEEDGRSSNLMKMLETARAWKEQQEREAQAQAHAQE